MEYILLGWSRSGVGVGVEVDIFSPESESESELLKIRRLHSPAYKYSCSRPVYRLKGDNVGPMPPTPTHTHAYAYV